MAMQFQPLTASQRLRVREIARSAYMSNRGHQHEAKRVATARIKAEFAASSILTAIMMKVVIAIAVNLAAKLIARWAMQQLSTPPTEFVAGEPGYPA